MANAGTGNQATLQLATTGAIGNVQSMTLPEWVSEKIDASHLGSTTFMEYIPGDLTDPGEITATVIFDTLVAIPANNVIEDITLTFPLQTPTNPTPAALTGSGFIRSYQIPELANETLQVATVIIAFDGRGTPPSYSEESAT